VVAKLFATKRQILAPRSRTFARKCESPMQTIGSSWSTWLIISGDQGSTIDFESRRYWHSQMVWWITWSACEHESHTGWRSHDGNWISYYYFDDTEDWSSTETEMVALTTWPAVLWTRCFGSSKAMGRYYTTKTTSLPSFWRRMVGVQR
jgi:hypothetical protein